jgi:extracellular elastinolytic metalloproteinase
MLNRPARLHPPRWSATTLLLLAVPFLAAGAAWSVTLPNSGQHEQRNFDARVAANFGFQTTISATQQEAVERLRAKLPELAVTFEPTSRAVHSIYNRAGYLTDANALGDPLAIALDYLKQNEALLGVTAADLAVHEVTDTVYNRATGATHVYLRQLHRGIPLYNGQLHVNVNRDGRVISVNNAFLPSLAQAVNVERVAGVMANEELLDAEAAVQRAAASLGIQLSSPPAALDTGRGVRRETEIDSSGISQSPIHARLTWLPIRDDDARLVWNFQIQTLDGLHWYDLTVDALTGQVWTRFDWTNSGTYRVYEQPVESPLHTTPATPHSLD